ncbi:MAG: DUF2829 domain-containing protein [Alistipes sp.]
MLNSTPMEDKKYGITFELMLALIKRLGYSARRAGWVWEHYVTIEHLKSANGEKMPYIRCHNLGEVHLYSPTPEDLMAEDWTALEREDA